MYADPAVLGSAINYAAPVGAMVCRTSFGSWGSARCLPTRAASTPAMTCGHSTEDCAQITTGLKAGGAIYCCQAVAAIAAAGFIAAAGPARELIEELNIYLHRQNE